MKRITAPAALAFVLPALAASACGGSDEDPSAGNGSAGAGTDGGEKPMCPDEVLPPGDSTIDLDFDTEQRDYRLHVPPSYDGSVPFPLVVSLHGFTNTAEGHEANGLNAEADERGYLVVRPNGTPSVFGVGNAWNAGSCCQGGVDDVGFLRRVVEDASARACVDRRRIYATGMSNGGFMTHRLGCEAADLFAAIAPVAGVMLIDDCSPSRPLPVLHFHGTGDTFVPFDGGASTIGGFMFPSVSDTIDFWVQHNGCDATPAETFRNAAAHCDSYTGCDAGVEVTLCTIDGGAHCWPGSDGCTQDISTNEHELDFFERFTLE